jgi:hypothetical protein
MQIALILSRDSDRSGCFMLGGRTIRLSLPRRLVCDLVHFAHKVPTVPVQRQINVGALAGLRSQLQAPRPSWCTLFTKAYGIVSAEVPELRRSYLPFPWARLYEHDQNIASVALERQYQGENGVFFAHFYGPEKLSLPALEQELRRFKEAPIEEIPDFRSNLFISRLPKPIRRFAWWYITHFRGYRKATWLGTYAVSVYSGLGAESLHPLTPVTTILNYGLIAENGDVTARIVYDHRVMDGATIARALARLEKVMNDELVVEMKSLLAVPALAR